MDYCMREEDDDVLEWSTIAVWIDKWCGEIIAQVTFAGAVQQRRINPRRINPAFIFPSILLRRVVPSPPPQLSLTMPPKKQQQQQKSKSKSAPKSKPQASAPKLQISAENERRLRRLLLNTERPAGAPPPPAAADTASRAQKAKRLRSVYDKLSLEGFSADQIEQALSALSDTASFETALDWLCLNITGSELPLKFSSAGSSFTHEGTEREVKIISIARTDWVPSQRVADESQVDLPTVRMRGRRDEVSLDSDKASQADWIRQYMEQEEEELEEEEDDPKARAASIGQEYRYARLGAIEAKRKGDKKRQDHFSDVIYKLKQEVSSLGLSESILDFQDESALDDLPLHFLESNAPDNPGSQLDVNALTDEAVMYTNGDECSNLRQAEAAAGLSDSPSVEVGQNNDEPDELELDNLFSEDSASHGAIPSGISRYPMKGKSPELAYGHMLGNIDDIWKKGDSGKIPKAVLQKLCQKLGWEAPKYKKLLEKENKFLYAVSILRKSTGRGKSRKAGGLISIQLPNDDEAFDSVEDAQNKVAAFALWQLFPDLPLDQLLTKSYSLFVIKWQEELSFEPKDTDYIRREDFVDSLLDARTTGPMHSLGAASEIFEEPDSLKINHDSPSEKPHIFKSANTGMNHHEEAESLALKMELENKMKLRSYKEMLEARATLPIAKLKTHLLQLLEENDVIVVCGETGCGKTTQVPQFILDDMIQSGLGGSCNIVCTQPRRIAAISVAERVSNERCELSPGSDRSLVGYQVRLDSARNEKTKLLFCTTGILLRKLAANKDLVSVSHVIVDEVHERSLLGDFLLIVLKKLIQKQSCLGRRKLKVILMSATVDSNLFSSYFGNCPVITAEGRTHSVSTYFLEDVYEKLSYSLPSDSLMSGAYMTPIMTKPRKSSVDNHRGKKNLVLSAWGDESLVSEEYINPHYIPELYESYSERTRQNLKKLNEDVIDFDLLEDLICYIDELYPPGAILVFLPGVAEIDLIVAKLTASFRFGGMASDWILPLHSSLASIDQRKVFLSPPENIRKVIVATDIAETSITIDDVTYVVDSGKHKENRYNSQKKMSSMVEDWISQANAKQRRGRAGRVKPGVCFCLYTRHRFEALMRPFQVPEMLRMPLTELCLQIKSLSLGEIKSFLLEAIEPPREETISSAVDLLHRVGAFEGNEELSPLGYHLAKLPVDVMVGKMLLYGAIFGCLSPILSVAAFLSHKSPFVYTKDEKQNVERAKATLWSDSLDIGTTSSEGKRQSDHLLMVVAYSKWAKILHENGVKAAQQFCRSFFLNSSVMYMAREMRIQFGSLLADIGLVNLPKFVQSDGKRKDKLDSWLGDMSRPFNIYANHSSVIKSILCAGLYPNVAATTEGIFGTALGSNKGLNVGVSTKDHPIWYDGRREVHIHPSSINYSTIGFRYPFLVFLEKVETSKIFLRDTSIISPYSILLFGGSILVQHQAGLVIIDGWLKLNAPAQTAVLFKELRVTLHAVLKELIRKPEMAIISNNEVLRSIVHLLLEEDNA